MSLSFKRRTRASSVATLKVAAVAVAAVATLHAPAHAALLAWEEPWTVTFNNTIPLGNKPAVFDGIDPIWHCGSDAAPNAGSCEADQGPLRAAFRYAWSWSTTQPLAATGSIQVRADDHYALYLNGRLVGSNWLETVAADGFDQYTLNPFLNNSGSNELLIFACDGRRADNIGSLPQQLLGSDLLAGWHGCPIRTPVGNHYLLVNGQVSLPSGQFSVDPVTLSLRGGEPSGWQVSAVPEPGALALVMVALAGIGVTNRRRAVQGSEGKELSDLR